MTAVDALRYPHALVDGYAVRGLIDKQFEILRSIQLHPELARYSPNAQIPATHPEKARHDD